MRDEDKDFVINLFEKKTLLSIDTDSTYACSLRHLGYTVECKRKCAKCQSTCHPY